MIIARNYFEINPNLLKLLFDRVNKGQLEINFNGKGIDLYSLSYYNFNILLHQTKNTIYHSLTDEFFDELSLHKRKMTFYGLVDDNMTSFTPTHIIYDHPHKKMGIYVKKKIVKSFLEHDINLVMSKKQPDESMTRFSIV